MIPPRSVCLAPSTDAQDGFGLAIAVDRNTLVVGAPREDGGSSGVNGDQNDASLAQSGAVYAFELDAPAVAAATVRNAGSNPLSYTATPFVPGQT